MVVETVSTLGEFASESRSAMPSSVDLCKIGFPYQKLWIPPLPVLCDDALPLGLQGVPGLEVRSCDIFLKTWSKYSFCQIATSTESFLSRKCLTRDFLSLEIFFWFPLLTALSGQFLLNDQCRRCDAIYFLFRCWIFSA